jgi:cytoskeleton protein RodZ
MSTPIGETLRRAREERGLSFGDAAERTCIRERYLRALEDEQFDVLGEDVYAKGFLRNYAKALGLDPAPLLDTYRAEYEHPPPDEAALTGQVLQGEERPLPRAVRTVAAAATIVLVFALLVAVGQQNDQPTAATPTETQAPAATDEVADAAPEPEPEPEPAPAPEPEPEPIDGVQVEMVIDGGESWLRVIVDGDIAFEGIKPEGASLTVAGDEEVFLRIGNAGAVRLIVNGEERGAAGDRGEVVERSYRVEELPSA